MGICLLLPPTTYSVLVSITPVKSLVPLFDPNLLLHPPFA